MQSVKRDQPGGYSIRSVVNRRQIATVRISTDQDNDRGVQKKRVVVEVLGAARSDAGGLRPRGAAARGLD